MRSSTSSSRRTRIRRFALPALLAVTAVAGFAQFRSFGSGGGTIWVPQGTETAREIGGRSTDMPEWENPENFAKDVFTFARLRYTDGGRGGGGWTTDLPDADINLSFRLQQMTSMKVDPDGRILKATDPELKKYPFLFAAAPGALSLNNAEILALREYLLNGGSMIMTDFWGDNEWRNCAEMFRQILPGLNFVELPLDHPLYSSVFRITDKGQVPNIDRAPTETYPNRATYEEHGGDSQTVHHRAIFDEKGRLLVLAIHNSDHSDGWEREGENNYYFHRFSEKIAYPLAINALVYMMTH